MCNDIYDGIYNDYVVDPSLCLVPLRRATVSSFGFGGLYNVYVVDPSWYRLPLRHAVAPSFGLAGKPTKKTTMKKEVRA